MPEPDAPHTRQTATEGIERAISLFGGRSKLEILVHLFGGRVMRFSELEQAIPGVSQKVLTQQLRAMEADELVRRTVYPEVPPRVDYALTDWGQALCPSLDALLGWVAARPEEPGAP